MKKILIIEDDQSLQKIYQSKLSNAGFTVIQATDGEEGIKSAKSDKPDLVILDIMLPGGPDGFIVLDRLKNDSETKKIPIIVATNVEDQVMRAIETGAVWYFVKAQTPIDTVVEKIRKILNIT